MDSTAGKKLQTTTAQRARLEQAASDQQQAREGVISKKEYELRQKALERDARAERNVRAGLPPDYESSGAKEWKRLLRSRSRSASRGTKKR